ncbi:hypothetical protein AAFM46_12030 [Arthrobacter sp. TMP15]|uniref:hypothetical protein n=1 Tax=Arthrobacter sp. TMP15 TaxID=3140789 RepID=UPI0031BB97C2
MKTSTDLKTGNVNSIFTWKDVRRTAVTFIAAAAALQIIFFGLLIVGQAVPDKPIIDNLAQAAEKGTYGYSGAADRMGGTSDTFTECVVAGTGLGSIDKNAFQRAIVMPRIGSCQQGKKQILELAATGRIDPAQVGEYYRYWAGYTVITRPIIATVGLSGMRVVAGALLVAGLLVSFATLARRTSKWAAVGLLGPLILATNLMSTPSTSFSQSLSISVILFGTAITAWAASKSIKAMVFGVGLSAALFCYMDLLTTPAIPWAFCTAVVVAIAYLKTRRVKYVLLSGALATGAWIIAFAGTWASRWAFAALFLGMRTTYKNVRKTVDFRTEGEYKTVDKSIFAPSAANWNYWVNFMPTAILILAICALTIIIFLGVASKRNGWQTLLFWLVLSLPALIIFVWYEVLSNHSQIHAFFTYRGIPSAIGVLTFAAVVLALRKVPETAPEFVEQDKLVRTALTKAAADELGHTTRLEATRN